MQTICHGHTFVSDLHLVVTFDHSLASHSSLVSLIKTPLTVKGKLKRRQKLVWKNRQWAIISISWLHLVVLSIFQYKISCQGCLFCSSSSGLFFVNEELKEFGLWHVSYFCHRFGPCSQHHSHYWARNGSNNDCVSKLSYTDSWHSGPATTWKLSLFFMTFLLIGPVILLHSGFPLT